MELLLRMLVGGAIVSLFALAGDVLKPKSFAGLFAAAPSVALASLGLTIMKDGPAYASIEARSMLAGAAALVLYARGCVYLMGSRHWHASPATLSLLPAWLVMALGLWALSLR